MAKGKIAIGAVVFVIASVILAGTIMAGFKSEPIRHRSTVIPSVLIEPPTLFAWINMEDTGVVVGVPQQGDFSNMRDEDYTFFVQKYRVALADGDKPANVKNMWRNLCMKYQINMKHM